MVRAPAQVLHRPAGFALLKPASRPQLDSARILTMSGTIAVNLLAAGLLMMPLAIPAPAAWVQPEPDMTMRPIKREPVVVEIVPVQPPVPVQAPVTPDRPRSLAPVADSIVAAAVIAESGTELATHSDAGEEAGAVMESIVPIATGPAPVQLEYARAPAPAYPRRAQRIGLAGTVTLQVLVGIDGQPLEVHVVQSSGHRELDEAARQQVLKRWSFRPATRDGVAIQAIGLVPVQFSLQR
ncbi:MAG: energy transducer TonB [Pseudomonadota bacterium]